jgi:hypothetical protein
MADKDRGRKAERRNGEPDPAGAKMREAAEAAHHRILDDPDLPEQPSGTRHLVYFTAVLVLAVVLNLAVLVLIAR